MSKTFISLLLAFGLITSLGAYELNGDLGVKWTGFKTLKKVPVSGSFKEVTIAISKDENFVKFLQSAKVQIQTASFDSKNPFRDKNITSTLFALDTSKTILASVVSVDEVKKELLLAITMNEVTKQILAKYEVKDSKIMAKGSIDILDFNLENSFLAFAKKCASFHENKSFSDVDVEFTLPFK